MEVKGGEGACRQEGKSGFVSTDVDVTMGTLVSYLNSGLLIFDFEAVLATGNINFHLI